MTLSLNPALEASKILLDREQARRKLEHFTTHTFKDFEVYPHHRKMFEFADRIISGEVKRAIVTLPPRHTKSEIFTRRLPAFVFGRRPNSQVIAASYTAKLINQMSRDIKKIMRSREYKQLFPGISPGSEKGADQVETWEVGDRGIFTAAGVRGALTGFGFHLGIIDDPIGDWKQANSKLYRDDVWNWYRSVFLTRAMPDATIIVIQTRWHTDDLTGRLLKEEPERWEHLHLPAINEDGEALWEEWHPLENLKELRASSSRIFEAQYQGKPQADSGNLIKRQMFPRYRNTGDGIEFKGVTYPLESMRRFQAYDFAFTAKAQNDATVIGTAHIVPGGFLAITHMMVYRDEMPESEKRFFAMYSAWKPMLIGAEAAAAQTGFVQLLRDKGLPIIPLHPDRDKVQRVYSILPHCEAGKILLPESASWLAAFEEELFAFPRAAHDDQTDVFVYLVDMFCGGLYAGAIGVGGIRSQTGDPHSPQITNQGASNGDTAEKPLISRSERARKSRETYQRNPFRSQS